MSSIFHPHNSLPLLVAAEHAYYYLLDA